MGSDADTRGIIGDADVLTALEGLLDKSLLRRQDLAGGGSRFRMLETIREQHRVLRRAPVRQMRHATGTSCTTRSRPRRSSLT